MRFIGFLLLFFLISTKAHSGETYGVILSGGYNLENNHYRYYNNTQEMYSAFRSAGLKRDNITTLYADGAEKGADTIRPNPWTLGFTNQEIDTPASLEGDGERDIKYSATSSGISATFDDLAKKVKPGDNLVFFITDHGSKYDGIVLWNGQTYSVGDLRIQLSKLPSSVTVQIATNICFGGQLLRLTAPNVCVVANSNDREVTSSNTFDDPFASSMAYAIKNPKRNSNDRASLMDAFEAGKDGDKWANNHHLTSIDYFIERQSLIAPETQASISCSNGESPITNIQKEITDISNYLSRVNDPRKDYYEKYLQQKLKDAASSLDSFRIQYSQWLRSGYQEDLDNLKAKWASLSAREKQAQRPYYTKLAEKLRAEDSGQRKKIEDLEEDQKRALAEMRFLKNASANQLEEYYSIRRCLEHAI
jgi:hypothetical protein